MRRRRLLQWLASATAVLPFQRIRVLAQPRDLSDESIAVLREIAPTVLPASLGQTRIDGVVDRFVAWTKGYREGVAMTHGYGHPRLQKTGASPVPAYGAQLAALDGAAGVKGAKWSELALETRRARLDEAFASAGVRDLPPRAKDHRGIAHGA